MWCIQLVTLTVSIRPAAKRKAVPMTETSQLTAPLTCDSTRSTPLNACFFGVLEKRRSVKPIDLGEPGPTPEELRRILTLACRVPDHGALVPGGSFHSRGGLAKRRAWS